MIVSDFLFFPGQRDRGPDDELHPLRPRLRPRPTITRWRSRWGRATATCIRPIRYAISTRSPQAANTSAERGYFRSWGIGRHIQGSQIFDYWRDPDGFLVEHFADGDMFDSTLEPGWAPFTASGLAQWGPPATKDFLGTNPKALPHEARSMITALRDDNEFDLNRLVGLLKVANS